MELGNTPGAPQGRQTKDFAPTETLPYEELTRLHADVFRTDAQKKAFPFTKWIAERAKCRTDLLYLGVNVLRKLFTVQTHGPLAEFFVQKDPTKLPVDYTRRDVIQWCDGLSEQKWRMLHCPRGGYKSTLNVVDTLQWFLCCPDLRIMIITGKGDLAQTFVSELKNYCTLREGAKRTLFQQLFPEYCGSVRELGASDTSFNCLAARLDNRESSLVAESILANLSGFHCDIEKFDDVVTDANTEDNETTSNSETIRARAKLSRKFGLATELVDPHGYVDIVGTPYSIDDLYSELLERAKEDGSMPILYLRKQAWKPKPGFEDVPLRELKSNQVDLWFPQVLTFAKLKQKLVRNERQFRCQQMCEPVESLECDFTEDKLRKCIRASSNLPVKGRVFNVWDTAVGTGTKHDFTVGIAAILDEEGRLYLTDGVKDKYKPSEKAYQIVKLAKQTLPERIAVENAQGIENLMPEIQRVALAHRVELPIKFFPPKNTFNAGGERIKNLELLIESGRLLFSASFPLLDEMFKQFLAFTGKKTGKKDDIIDAVSFLQRFIPGVANTEWLEQEAKEREEAQKAAIQKQMHDAIFGASLQDQLNRPAPIPRRLEPEEEQHPLNRIFGKTGIRAY